MNTRNAGTGLIGAFGALLWAGVAASPPAHAEAPDYTIFPPGDLHLVNQEVLPGPFWGPFYSLPWATRDSVIDSYQVLDDAAVTGAFDVQRDHTDYLQTGNIVSPGLGLYNLNWLFPMGHQIHEEISDATGSAKDYDGAVHDLFQWALNLNHPDWPEPLVDYPTFVIFGNEYWETSLGSADYVTILGLTFPLFDTLGDSVQAVAAATDPGLGLVDALTQIG